MRISIFGMGYVGVVSGACLVRDGHTIVGVDPVESKVNDFAEGRSPIQEPGIAELLVGGNGAKRLFATTDPERSLENADMVWICVGTPSSLENGLDLTHIEMVIKQIGKALRSCGTRPLIVLRSTVLPGTTENVVIPILEEESGLEVGKDLHVVFHPEFLRESTAVDDFDNPPKIVVGETVSGAADLLMELYRGYDAPKFRLRTKEAELVKYCDNLFHAVKVTFANEIGALAHSAGVDARKVSEVFCADTKLNISTRYLRPGFAYGGSCLPKDLRAILRYATLQSIPVPLLNATLDSNKAQIETFVNRVLAYQPRKVGMVGLAFKPNTDDMRESPFVTVAKRLIGEGVTLRIYDPNVHPDKLIGSNKFAVMAALGHLERLLVGTPEDLDKSDVILVNHPTVSSEQVQAWLNAGVRVMDLVSLKSIENSCPNYEGIAW